MRFLLTISLLALASAAAAESQPAYPFWDGSESIEQYAKRAHLPPTKTLDLGDGVKLELVLIPAGTFTMGTPEPSSVDAEGFRSKIARGQTILATGCGLLWFLFCAVISEALRKKRRPQYSLAYLLAMTVASGIGLLGGLHWFYTARAFDEAQIEYTTRLARFENSYGRPTAHEVTLSTPYYLGRFEVTQEQYQKVMGNNPSRFKGRDLPVEGVFWDEAQGFCSKVGEVTGSVVRLPTEAEWECACRAGTKTTYYTGDSEADLDRAGWFSTNRKQPTYPGGQKVPNAWGVYDMHGNLWEWCSDWFEFKEPVPRPQLDPVGLVHGRFRVVRGGSWKSNPGQCQSSAREELPPTEFRADFIGFRVAVSPPGTP